MANTPFFARHGLNVADVLLVNTSILGFGILTVNSTATVVGNSTVYTFSNSSILQVVSAAASSNLQPGVLTLGTSVVNTTTFAAGANVIISTSTVSIGNSTVNTVINSVLLKVANSTVTTNVNPAGLIVGTTSVNSSVISVAGGASINSTAFVVGSVTITASGFTGNGANLTSLNGSQVTTGTVPAARIDTSGFAVSSHTHADLYSPLGHDHSGIYAPLAHNHSGVYVEAVRLGTSSSTTSDPSPMGSGLVLTGYTPQAGDPKLGTTRTWYRRPVQHYLAGWATVTSI